MHITRPAIGIMAALLLDAAGALAGPPVYDIPRMDKVVIDGRTDDWTSAGSARGTGGGFRIDLLAPPEGEPRPAGDLDARVRLAWNARGLLILATVRDDKWIEHADEGWLWRYDGIEVFLAARPGDKDLSQWAISPGMTAGQPKLRRRLHDHRKTEALKKLPAAIEAARRRTDGGYVLEALLPWGALAIDPKPGRQVAFQIWVNDADKPEGQTHHAAWFPGTNTGHDSTKMHRLRLTERPGPGVLIRSTGEYDWALESTRIRAVARAQHAGKTVTVFQSGRAAGKAVLAKGPAGVARAQLMVPTPTSDTSLAQFSVLMPGAAADTPRATGEKSVRTIKDLKNITDAELFASMRLDRPGLAKVKAAVAKKDFPEAYRQWGRYFAKRTKPRWYVNNRTYGPGMKARLPKLAEVILSRARNVAKKDIVHGGVRLGFRDGKPDFTSNPTGSTNFISIYNLYLVEPLGRAYLITGRDEFADAYRLYVRTLYEQRNRLAKIGGHGDLFWIELQLGLRTMHLLDAYLCLRGYPGLTAKDHEAALKFFLCFGEMLADHDRNDAHASTPNQRMAGMCALGLLGVMLPEFRYSDEWRGRGVADVTRTLEKTVYPDGAHVELCTQYHMTVIRDPGKLSMALALNGRKGLYGGAPGAAIFRKLHTWLAHATAPDGFLPPLHSGVWATEWLAYLMVYEHFNPGSGFAPLIARFGGPDYVPVAKGGPGDMLYLLTPDVLPKKPSRIAAGPPKPGCRGVNLQPSGLGVMRSGPGRDATYLATLYGKPVGGHGYPQLGSFVLYSRGKWLALHPGSPFDYSDPNYRAYYHTTFSHNTVIVDGTNQAFLAGGSHRAALGARCDAWVRTPKACILRITHAGYEKIAGVMHTRTFFLLGEGWAFIHDRLRPAGGKAARHTYDWALHTQLGLREGKARALRAAGLAVVPAYPEQITGIDRQKKPCMLPVHFEQGLRKQQGTANQYYLRKLRKAGKGATFGVGLFPLAAGGPAPSVKPLTPPARRGGFEAFEITTRTGRYVILVRNAAKGNISAAGVSTAATAAAARLEDGKVTWKVEAEKAKK